jgi:hypothetical protein
VIDAADEVKQFVSKLMRVEAGDEFLVPPPSRPLNFTLTPIDVTLFGRSLRGIAIAENPAFDFLGGRDQYCGRYVVVVDDESFFTLVRIKGEADPSYLARLQGLRQ